MFRAIGILASNFVFKMKGNELQNNVKLGLEEPGYVVKNPTRESVLTLIGLSYLCISKNQSHTSLDQNSIEHMSCIAMAFKCLLFALAYLLCG